MAWPTSQDYNEAIQDPRTCLNDPELCGGAATTNPLGMPQTRSGNFADVYEFHCPGGGRYALKCFTREVRGLQQRYQAISDHLRQAKLPFTVDFNYLEKGVRIRGAWYPLLKMQWVEGFTLNTFVRDHLDKPATLEGLIQIWLRMARRLREAQLAHADLQHGNVLLVPGNGASSLAVRLIDYDGMFIPALAGSKSGEVGHPAYQHPQRLREGTYNAEVDRFPTLVIVTALRCLVAGGRGLWDRYDNGDNLLFREADLCDPGKSALFGELRGLKDPAAVELVKHLAGAAYRPLDQAPLLEELLQEKKAAAPAAKSPVAQATAKSEPALDFGATGPVSRIKRRPAASARKRSLKVPVLLGVAFLVLGGGWFAWKSFRHQPESASVSGGAPVRGPASLALLPVAEATVKAGTGTILDIQVERKEYTGPITLSVEGLPANVVAQPATIAANELSGRIKLDAAGTAAATATRVRIIARGGDLSARSEVQLTVRRGRALVLLPLADVTLKPGESKTLEIKIQRQDWEGPVQVTVEGLPDAVKAEPATIGAKESAAQVSLTTTAAAEPTQKRFQVLVKVGDLSAQGSARLTVTSPDTPVLLPIPDVTLKPGESKDLKIEVQRNGFRGPIRVTLAGLPDKVTAAPATIGADESAVLVTLTAAADAGGAEKSFQVVATADKLKPTESQVRLTIQKPAVVVVKRAPEPDATAQAKAEKVIKDTFKTEFAKLKASDRTALAAKLTQVALETKDDPAARFVLLREARDLAAQAGDLAGALKAVEHLAETYAIDVPEMKLTVLNKASKTATTAALNQALTETCLTVLEEEIAADNYGVALRLLDMAEAASKKTGVAALVTRTQARGREIREAQKEYELAKAAAETLKQKPDDAQANLDRGKYLCRRKGAWEQGLPLLARGADPALRDLALMDLKAPEGAAEQTVVGDGWWDLAEKEQGQAKVQLLRRAHTWYQRAVPGLSGITKVKVEKRIAEVETIRMPSKYINSLGMPFVLVPRGKFWMGGSGGKPGDKEVEIPQDFYLGIYLVTQEEWQNVMERNPSCFSRAGSGKDKVKDITDAHLKRFPVETVSWDDCQEFVKRLNEKMKDNGWEYRLPTEAQWEYACRGGPGHPWEHYGYDFYLNSGPTNTLPADKANFSETGLQRTCKVGTYPPNPLGLYDMHGNVWEWCADEFSPRAPQRVYRGGSWSRAAGGCRAASRISGPPAFRDNGRGLRLSRVPVGNQGK